ncbi:ATP-binding protein [Candidatus Bipolaricaulota bacterium]
MDVRPAQERERRRIEIRLQDAAVVGLVILLVASIGIASTVWYWNWRQAAGDSARMVQSEIGSRIEDHILRFLAIPHEISEVNAAALRLVDRDTFGPHDLETLFLEQIRVFETISSIYAGSPEGGLVDAGREGAGGLLYVIETAGFRSGSFNKYRVDNEGSRGELLSTIPDFDATTRPWFTEAVETKDATWSDIYVLFSGQDMAVAASRPVYDVNGNLLLVLSSDIFLSQIDEFLGSLEYGETGLGFIIERSGLLVASSTDTPPLRGDNTDPVLRVLALDSQSSLIQQTARFLQETFGELATIDAGFQGEFSLDGDRLFVQVRPIRDAYGIDWLSVIVIPESDFLGPIIASMKTALILLAIALTLTIGAGVVFAKRVTRPLEELASAAQAMGESRFVQIPHSKRIREIRDLSFSLEDMGNRLDSTLGNLREEIDEREQAQRTLQESEELLRMYIEKAPIAIFVTNAAGQYTDVNPAAAQMTGYSREDLLRMGILGLIGADEPDADLSLFHNLKETGLASGESRLQKKDGTELWIQIDAVALAPDRLVAFCTDITQRRQTEESMRHQQKMESLGTMARGVAHEINNPLMGMMSYSELLEARISDPDAKKYAKNILREGERIAHIIRNLLSFAREDKGARHPADIRHIIADALPLVHNALLRSHITIHEDHDEAIPEVNCSRQQIQQVIVNLLMNARDALDVKYPQYDEDKIIQLRVTSVEHAGDIWVRTSIEDHGAGMTKDGATRAFDPFFTTKSRDERTGLGLTISFGIIQEHGGKIEIESKKGEGTTVHFDLPAINQQEA